MSLVIDRTKELEERLKAIHINPNDTCIFFSRKENCTNLNKQCDCCRFAHFEYISNVQTGLCKFKK